MRCARGSAASISTPHLSAQDQTQDESQRCFAHSPPRFRPSGILVATTSADCPVVITLLPGSKCVQVQDDSALAATAEEDAVLADGEPTSPGTAPAPLPESRLGPDDFQVLKVVGQGAFGKVRAV